MAPLGTNEQQFPYQRQGESHYPGIPACGTEQQETQQNFLPPEVSFPDPEIPKSSEDPPAYSEVTQ
jgi:hypothetical protein